MSLKKKLFLISVIVTIRYQVHFHLMEILLMMPLV